MASPAQTSALPQTTQLKDLATALEKAVQLYGSPKAYARLALEDPASAALCVKAAKDLTGPLRQIQALA